MRLVVMIYVLTCRPRKNSIGLRTARSFKSRPWSLWRPEGDIQPHIRGVVSIKPSVDGVVMWDSRLAEPAHVSLFSLDNKGSAVILYSTIHTVHRQYSAVSGDVVLLVASAGWGGPLSFSLIAPFPIRLPGRPSFAGSPIDCHLARTPRRLKLL